jgi:hypothetical protein
MWLAAIGSRSPGRAAESIYSNVNKRRCGGGYAALRATRTAVTVSGCLVPAESSGRWRSRWTCDNSHIRQFRQTSHHSFGTRPTPSEHQPAVVKSTMMR